MEAAAAFNRHHDLVTKVGGVLEGLPGDGAREDAAFEAHSG